MEIKKAGSKIDERTGQWFTGDVRVDPTFQAPIPRSFQVPA